MYFYIHLIYIYIYSDPVLPCALHTVLGPADIFCFVLAQCVFRSTFLMTSSEFPGDLMNHCVPRRTPRMSVGPEEPVPVTLPRTWTPPTWNPVD